MNSHRSLRYTTLVLLSLFCCGLLNAQKDSSGRFTNIDKLSADWKKVKPSGDSLFVAKNSEMRPALLYYPAGTYPNKPGLNFAASQKGDVIGPYKELNTYFLYKNAGAKKSADSVQVSHILYAYSGAVRAGANVTRSREQAKKSADSLCRLIRNGKVLLENVVEQVTDDPGSKAGNKGNYGWFTHESGFVPEYKAAAFDNPVGSTVVIETIFGFHIIQVEAKTKEKDYNTFWEIVKRIDTCFTLNGTAILLNHPEYPGGMTKAYDYVKTQQAQYDSLNAPRFKGATVIVKFDVMEDGSVKNVLVFRSVISGTKAEKELTEIILSMSSWRPARTCAGNVAQAQTMTIKL